jgi:hypothetical protein
MTETRQKNEPQPSTRFRKTVIGGCRLNRRQFVSACAACAACGTLWAKEADPRKPKVRLVFCETPNDRPIWPHIGYDWVSSFKDVDIVASARHFALIGKGKSAAEVVAAFRAERHGRTPEIKDWKCLSDEVAAPNFDEALRRLRETKLVIVGGGRGGPAFCKAAKETLGVNLVHFRSGDRNLPERKSFTLTAWR